MHQSLKNYKMHCFVQYVQEKTLGKTGIACSEVRITSAIVHLSGLSAILEHTAAAVTWQDRDAL